MIVISLGFIGRIIHFEDDIIFHMQGLDHGTCLFIDVDFRSKGKRKIGIFNISIFELSDGFFLVERFCLALYRRFEMLNLRS